MITIVGVGTGYHMLTIKGLEVIKKADVVIGASRMIEENKEYIDDNAKIYKEYHAEAIADMIAEHDGEKIAILVSGDTGFYSLTKSLIKSLEAYMDQIEIIPGISSVNSFFSKLQMPWQECAFVSIHGRDNNIVDIVRRNHLTFALIGKDATAVAKKLIEVDLTHIHVYIGSQLDHENEKIEKLSVFDLAQLGEQELAVLLFENSKPDASIRCGIADEEFVRGEVPMTKAEIRACVMSKLKIKPTDVCYDIGAGTGSVTVEMALSAWNGCVYAFEKKDAAITLIHENIKKFHVGNVSVYQGEALSLMRELEEYPNPDVAFIGGSDGRLKEMIAFLMERNPKIRIVITAIALETLQAAMEACKEYEIDAEIAQISVSKNKSVGALSLMIANNSVYIISGKRDE